MAVAMAIGALVASHADIASLESQSDGCKALLAWVDSLCKVPSPEAPRNPDL